MRADGRHKQLLPSASPAVLAIRVPPAVPQAMWQAMPLGPRLQLTIVANHPTPRAPSHSQRALTAIAFPSVSPAAACHPGSKGTPSTTTASAGCYLWGIGNFLQPASYSCLWCNVAQLKQCRDIASARSLWQSADKGTQQSGVPACPNAARPSAAYHRTTALHVVLSTCRFRT